MSIEQQGWQWPVLASKAHYYKAGEAISLCGKWMLTGDREDYFHESPDNCKDCQRRRLKLTK